MFWGRYEKERLRRTYHAKLPQAISRLEKTDIPSLFQVYCAVTTEDRKLVQSRGRAIEVAVKHVTMKQVIQLSKHFRRYTSTEWSIDWKELDIGRKKDWYRPGRNYSWVLALGSFHPKGYYRQVYLEEIAGYPSALPFLVLCLNDWVGQVRSAIARAILTRLGICLLDELFMAVMALDKVKRSRRKDDQVADTPPVSHGND